MASRWAPVRRLEDPRTTRTQTSARRRRWTWPGSPHAWNARAAATVGEDMSITICVICGEGNPASPHDCNPEWECEVDGEDWGNAPGVTAEDAAQHAAESYWDHTSPPDQDETVIVRVKVDAGVIVFNVAAVWSLSSKATRLPGVTVGPA